MNIYHSDTIYSDVLRDEAETTQRWAQRKVKDSRRLQRRAKQAQKNAHYDSY